ncbi:MAG: hypothetical protein WBM41_15250 [Arenicellales bacterium]
MKDNQDKTRLVGIFSMPGEGLVVELGFEEGTALFDRQGLQYRIIQRKQVGFDTSTEESALTQMNSFSPVFDV